MQAIEGLSSFLRIRSGFGYKVGLRYRSVYGVEEEDKKEWGGGVERGRRSTSLKTQVARICWLRMEVILALI